MKSVSVRMILCLTQIYAFDIHGKETSPPSPSTPPQPPLNLSSVPAINATFLSRMYKELKKTYDKKFRPNFQDKPTSIGLDFHVLSFDNLDEGSMEYGVDFYFAQIWFDERLRIQPSHPKGIINLIGKDVEEIWLPDTVFVNSKSSKFHQVTISNRFLSVNMSNGLVIYHSRITTLASCQLDLRHYPFDQQTCYLAIESYGYDKSEIMFNWFDTNTGKECENEYCMKIHVYDKDMSNFYLLEAVKSKNSTSYNANSFSSASTVFSFRRRSLYFIFQIYLPSSLIVMVAWASFWITPTAVPARIAICVTTILTLVTMMGIANVNMPRVSYIKALDLYLLVSCLFVFSALFEFIIVLNSSTLCVMKFIGAPCKCQTKSKDLSTKKEKGRKEKEKKIEMKENCREEIKESKNGFEPYKGVKIHSEIEKCSDNEVSEMDNNDNNKEIQSERAMKTCFVTCRLHKLTRRSSKSKPKAVDSVAAKEKKVISKHVKLNDCLTFSTVLDILARILFPMSYILFVLGYYIKYKSPSR